jgi:nitrite reductase (NO-forming)
VKQPLPAVAGQVVAAKAPLPEIPNGDVAMARGKAVYERVCAACHLPDGTGVAGVFPPLANSDFFQERPYEMAYIVLHGRSGKLVVNGEHYNGVMPPQDLNDNDVAAVINYINVAMNQGKPVLTAEQVSEMRQVKK